MKVTCINNIKSQCYNNSVSNYAKKSNLTFGLRADILELGNMGAKYSKVNPEFNIERVEGCIRRSAPTLPNSLIIFVNMPLDYAKTKTSTDNFASSCIEFAPIFFKRINVSEDSGQFRKTYSPEIDMIKNMLNLCSGYLNNKFPRKEFDGLIEDILSTYADTLPDKRNAFFVN